MEAALNQLMLWVEKLLDQWETALGIFLDIQGAFNTSFDSMCAALFNHGVDHIIVRWLIASLEGHLPAATHNIFSTSIAVSSGCPQGGVLSPILMSFFVDNLIARLIGCGICTYSRLCR
jgi:hypothetical protein